MFCLGLKLFNTFLSVIIYLFNNFYVFDLVIFNNGILQYINQMDQQITDATWSKPQMLC